MRARALMVLSVSAALVLVGTVPALAAPVRVRIQAPDEMVMRTTGPGPKFNLTYGVTDRDRKGYLIKTCSYSVQADEYLLCESRTLSARTEGLVRTDAGWRYKRFYRYTEAVTNKQCRAVNKSTPEFVAYVWIKDRDREVIAEAQHPYTVSCEG